MDNTQKKLIAAMALATLSMTITIVRLVVSIIMG